MNHTQEKTMQTLGKQEETQILKDTRTLEYLKKIESPAIDAHCFFNIKNNPHQGMETPPSGPEILNSHLKSLGIFGLVIPHNVYQNTETPKIVEKYDHIIGGYLHFNPNQRRKKGLGFMKPEEMRYIAENKCIVGMKTIPTLTRVRVIDYDNDPYLEIASNYNLPVLFHCSGQKKEFDSVKQFRILDERFPKIKKITAHMGGFQPEFFNPQFIIDAVRLAEENKNFYMTTTALNKFMRFWHRDKNTLEKKYFPSKGEEFWNEVFGIFKESAERVPDKIIWGTDLGSLDSFDEQSMWPIYNLNNKEVESKILSENALHLFERLEKN